MNSKKLFKKIFLVSLLVLFVSLLSMLGVVKRASSQIDCGSDIITGTLIQECADGSGSVSVQLGSFNYCGYISDYADTTTNSCYTCNNGEVVCITFCNHNKSSGYEVCASPNQTCCHYDRKEGDCSSSPVEQNYCDLINPLATYKGVEHTCTGIGTGDLTVEIGQTFDLGYTYLGTGPTYVPWEVRTIMRGPQGVPPTETLNCVYNEDETAGVWHATNKAGITCPATPGTYDYIIRCKAAGSSSIVFCGQFDDSLGCRVKCVAPPISLGYLKLYHQGLGTIKLNLIHMNDALLKSPFPGMVKVARFNGDTNTAADLVAVSDPNASPVRIYTGLTGVGSPNGIWSWKKLP